MTITRARSASPRQPRQSPEHKAQSDFFTFIRTRAHRYPALKWIHSSLNGVHLTPSQAGKAKSAGMVAGIPDIFVPVPRMVPQLHQRDRDDNDLRMPGHGNVYVEWVGGLFIEMKAGKNGLTDEQKAFQNYCASNKFRFVVCRSWIEAARTVGDYLGIPAAETDFWNALHTQTPPSRSDVRGVETKGQR